MKGAVLPMLMAALMAVLAAAALTVARPGSPAPSERALATRRACAAAAGDVRVLRLWLPQGHPRRAQALLLLGHAAAWAPVCASDVGVGAALQAQILSDLAGDTGQAFPLSERLLALLE